jgi:hypothetical protein
LRVGDERKRQLPLFGEHLLPFFALGGINRNRDDLHVVGVEFGLVVAQQREMIGATAGEAFGKEGENDGFLALEVALIFSR